MKIAIVVHGRFHAFDLARELIRLEHDVCVLTNYPKRVAGRFGIPPNCIRNNVLHGIVSRVANRIDEALDRKIFEPATHRWFSRWAAEVLKRERVDVVHGFSGVCEEVFLTTAGRNILRMLVRGSAHIEEQYEILCAEERRTTGSTYKASNWMRQREVREYALADVIVVLSQFAFDSFLHHGVEEKKLRLLLLGTQRNVFRPDPVKINERRERILKRQPLRVLTVGTFSYRKGVFDLVEVARQARDFAVFRFVGTILPKAAGLAKQANEVIQFIPKVAQFDLPQHYDWADVFLFPTLEDGYAVVLAQAAAAGLPILSTTNCAAPDMLKQGENGWVFPIRRPDLLVEKLRWCDQHREELANMVEASYKYYMPRDWSDVAQDFAEICTDARLAMAPEQSHVARA